jgi:hypothetical protein
MVFMWSRLELESLTAMYNSTPYAVRCRTRFKENDSHFGISNIPPDLLSRR